MKQRKGQDREEDFSSLSQKSKGKTTIVALFLPSVAEKRFHLSKKEVRRVHEDFSWAGLYIDAALSLFVFLVMVFYLFQGLVTDQGDFFSVFFSHPSSAAAHLIMMFSSLITFVYAISAFPSQKRMPIGNNIIENFFAISLFTGMMLFYGNDASTFQLNQTQAISPSILWIAILFACPIPYLLNEVILSGSFTFMIILLSCLLNNKFGVNVIYQYIIVAVVYFFAALLYHNVFFFVTCQQHYIQYENERLAENNRIDPLTLCLNRNGLKEFLSTHNDMIIPEPGVLFMFDIDHFKEFNDTCSHLEGDQVLQNVAYIIHQKFPKDILFIRWGGDEFLILGKVKDREDAREFGEKLRTTISSLSKPDKLPLTISIGGTYLEENTVFSFQDSFSKVDSYLYQAKNKGRDRLCLDGEIITKE